MNQQLPYFSVSIQTPSGERGCRVQAFDAIDATKIGVERLAIRDDEIPSSGLDLRVKVTQ